MCLVLDQRRLKFPQQLLCRLGRMSPAAEPCDQLFLSTDVPLPQGDVIVHHFEVGGAEGHALE